eukprot:1145267-Pelagomonas_calceolata.AAC.2
MFNGVAVITVPATSTKMTCKVKRMLSINRSNNTQFLGQYNGTKERKGLRSCTCLRGQLTDVQI